MTIKRDSNGKFHTYKVMLWETQGKEVPSTQQGTAVAHGVARGLWTTAEHARPG